MMALEKEVLDRTVWRNRFGRGCREDGALPCRTSKFPSLQIESFCFTILLLLCIGVLITRR
jgi:hypothetical protein